ncbi:hypothetical protein ACFX2I_015464 [Malus domestica]
MASKLCDSCQSATATLYCRTDSAFLCVNCNSKIHAASWLLPNPKAVENPDLNSGQCLFQEMDPYLDLDYGLWIRNLKKLRSRTAAARTASFWCRAGTCSLC